MTRWLAALLFAGLLPAPVLAEGGGVPWTDEPRTAFALAEKESKPVLVDVWATWCAPCKEMDRTTYKDPAVLAGVARFVALKIDADVQKTFIEKYQVDAYPTVLVLDAKGREISRFRGFLSAGQLLPVLRHVGGRFEDYLAVANPRDTVAEEKLGRFLLAAGNPEGAADHLGRALKKLPATEAGRRDELEVTLAEAQLGTDDVKRASAVFARLADTASDPDVKARALTGLWKAEKARGREKEAAGALERLRHEFPDRVPASSS